MTGPLRAGQDIGGLSWPLWAAGSLMFRLLIQKVGLKYYFQIVYPFYYNTILVKKKHKWIRQIVWCTSSCSLWVVKAVSWSHECSLQKTRSSPHRTVAAHKSGDVKISEVLADCARNSTFNNKKFKFKFYLMLFIPESALCFCVCLNIHKTVCYKILISTEWCAI